jgi:SPP1 gp7 family putative phage head morphogenesis protein
MLYDSVFGTFRYSDAPDLMPASEIIATMDKIERAALKSMNAATKAAVSDLVKRSRGKSLAEIKKLTWDLQPDIAESLNVLWDKGFKSGSTDAIKELRAAVPLDKKRTRTNNTELNISQYASIADLIKKIFTLKPFSAFDGDRPKAWVKSVLNRNLMIAGDYAKEFLDRVKDNISQGMIEQPNGYTLPPAKVNLLIQETLGVSQSRAATISRTETTNAYSEARVETFKQSSLATHCRFLAITDDRVTDICLTRNGIVFPISEAPKYQPALHFNCRSTISVLLPKINPAHAKMIADPNFDPANRTLAPLLKGWR